MPKKHGIEALKAIHRKNPHYFDHFLKEADRRAVQVLGPLFEVDMKTWQRFREENLVARSQSEQALRHLYQQLSALMAETSQGLSPSSPTADKRSRRSKIRRSRLSAEEKENRAKVKRLRLQAYKLVVALAKKRKVSPAVVYAELTKKYGRKAKDADVKELQHRITFLRSKT